MDPPLLDTISLTKNQSERKYCVTLPYVKETNPDEPDFVALEQF